MKLKQTVFATGEMLFHHVVRASAIPGPEGWKEFAGDCDSQPVLRTRAGYGRAITIAHAEGTIR